MGEKLHTGKPIKSFIGKSFTKDGITKSYFYNPELERWGWYNVNEYATELGREMIDDYEFYGATTKQGIKKTAILRDNIKTVIETLSNEGSYIEGVDDLLDAMRDKINEMSDFEIDSFSSANKKSINLYFEYRDVNIEGLDARIINMAKAMGIDIYQYIENDEVPDNVQNVLNNINDYVKLGNEFEDEFTDEDLGYLPNKRKKEKKR